MKFRNWLDKLLETLAVLSFSGIIITVAIQIMSRYLPYTAIWTEELTRYFFIYAVCFAAPLALLRGEFISVDLIVGRMSNLVRRFYEIGIYGLIIILNGVMVIEGWNFTKIGNAQTSATMPFQMSMIHVAIPIMSFLLIFYSIVKVIQLVRNEKKFDDLLGGGEI